VGDLAFYLLLYVLIGLMYSTWVVYLRWFTVIVPVCTGKLPTVLVVVLILCVLTVNVIAWPVRFPCGMFRRWKTRNIPRHVVVLTDRIIAGHVADRIGELRELFQSRT